MSKPRKMNLDRSDTDITHHDGRYWILHPAAPDEGMDLERGPFFTRWGARLSRWLYG